MHVLFQKKHSCETKFLKKEEFTDKKKPPFSFTDKLKSYLHEQKKKDVTTIVDLNNN